MVRVKGHIGFITLLTLVMALGSVTAQATKMYRWTDANGNPVVSDRPPPEGTPFTEISSTYTPNRRRRATRETPVSDPEPIPEPPVAADAKVPALCKRAMDHIEKLENAPSIAVADGAGNVRVLSDQERATQLANAQRMAAQHCDN